MKDQQHNKDIEELLKQFKTQKHEPLDDFEREALEGFEMLDSKNEALQTKKDLDERAHRELFAKEKETKRVYWFAAAGLFLVIGLSVYFILNNPQFNQKDVALVQKVEQQLPEDKTIVVPAEEAPAPTVASSGEKNQRDKATKEPEPAKEIAAAEKKEEEGLRSRAVLKPAAITIKAPEAENAVAIDKRDDAEDTDKEKGKIASKDANLDVATESRNSNLQTDSKSENKKTEVYADDLAKSDKTVLKEAENRGSAGKKSNRKSKSKAASVSDEENVAKSREEKAPVTNGFAGTGNYATGTSDNQTNTNTNTGNGPVNATPKTAAAQTAVPAFNEKNKSNAQEYNAPGAGLYYWGGESALKSELATKLSEKNVNKKFDVLLIINEKKKVEKVNYLNVYDLTAEERDKVTDVLKGLTKFNFNNQPVAKGSFEYKLEYRP